MPKIFLTIVSGCDAFTVKTNNNPEVYLSETEYSDEDSARILAETQEWNIEVKNSEGHDYGYGRDSETITYTHKPVTEDIIVVENGHFAGVLMRSSGSSFNKEYTKYDDLVVTFIKDYIPGEGLKCARDGSSFSSDDHETWDLYFYYLKKKTDNKE